MLIRYRFSFGRQASVALWMMLVIALGATACGDPQVPVARSTSAVLQDATPVPVPPTSTPVPPPTAEPTLNGGPVATVQAVKQPGLSSDTIRLAVIFDQETQGVADDLFRDAWLGALAWERQVNTNGGLAGRQVELVPHDSRLYGHRAALEQVCAGDFFAIVGSQSLGDAEGAELLGTEECKMADFPGQVYGSRRAASPVTFLSNPFLNGVRQAGPAQYLVETFPDAAQNLGLLRYSALDLERANEREREMLIAQGMEPVLELPVDLQEDPAERVVVRWEETGAESLVWVADSARLIRTLEALATPPQFVLCEWGCYSQQFLNDGGAAVEGVYAWIAHSPFESANERGELFLYRGNLASVAPDAGWSEVGFQSWMAGRLFEASFESLLAAEPEAPTREQLISIAREINFYTANGVLSATNPAAGEPTPCFVLLQVRNGRWEQAYPEPLGDRDQDCTEDNLYDLVTTRSLGLTALSAATSEDAATTDTAADTDLENPAELDE